MAFGKKAPSIPAMTSAGHVHPVMKNEHGNVAVRHPALPGPSMMSPRPDHIELPAGSSTPASAAGGINGGLAPFQTQKGAKSGDFMP